MMESIKARLRVARRSWTVWFNGMVSSVTGTLLALPMDQVINYMPQLQPYLESELFRKAMLVLMLVNVVTMVLRVRKV